MECSYALMGACALLGGIQRATIALVVIMLEGAQCTAMQCTALHCTALHCTAARVRMQSGTFAPSWRELGRMR